MTDLILTDNRDGVLVVTLNRPGEEKRHQHTDVGGPARHVPGRRCR